MSYDFKLINGDLNISNNGDLNIVEDNNKLVQDILKIASTLVGANPFFPWYGSYIVQTLIGNVMDFTMKKTMAVSQLSEALGTLQKLQAIQMSSGQSVTPGELIAAIKSINIEQGYGEPRLFKIFIEVLTKAMTVEKIDLDVHL